MGGHASGGHAKPTAIKVLRAKAKVTRRDVRATGDLGEPPAHFDAELRDAWRYAIETAPPGLLKRVDSSILETWCTAHVLQRRALCEISTNGMLIKSPSGFEMQSPYVAILNKQEMILLRCVDHLGFSPAARSRVASDPEDTRGDWADIATGA